jgi:hypothetical protein
MYNVETDASLRHDLVHVGVSFVNHAAIDAVLLRRATVDAFVNEELHHKTHPRAS